jgi:sulfatase maturation enzyme AslB (radical SAM superfamily)
VAGLDRIESLSLILTSRCNLRCGYCYQSPKRRRSAAWRTIRAALDLVSGASSRVLGIGFCGGEPLLEFPLMRRAVERVERIRPPTKTVTYHVSTNGTLLTETVVSFLEEHRFETQLSFDGVVDAQNLRGRGTFPALDRLLERLRSRHPAFYREKVSIAVTVTPRNLPHLAASVSYFFRKGARRIVIAPSISSDADWEPGRIGELDAQFAMIFERSLLHFERTGEVPVGILRGRDDAPGDEAGTRSMCGIGRARGVTVDVDGEVYPCAMFASSYARPCSPRLDRLLEGMRLGRIADPALPHRLSTLAAAARRAGIFHRKDRKRSAYERCGECEYLDRCFICPASIRFVPGNGDPDRVPDFCCAFNLVALKYRERFPREPALHDLPLTPPGFDAEMERWRILAGAAR